MIKIDYFFFFRQNKKRRLFYGRHARQSERGYWPKGRGEEKWYKRGRASCHDPQKGGSQSDTRNHIPIALNASLAGQQKNKHTASERNKNTNTSIDIVKNNNTASQALLVRKCLIHITHPPYCKRAGSYHRGERKEGMGGSLHPCMSHLLTSGRGKREGGIQSRGRGERREGGSNSYCGSRKEMELTRHASLLS